MKLVVFDVDGTLVDSQNYICEAQRRAFLAHGLEPPPRDKMLSIVGLSLVRAFEVLAPGAPADSLAEAYKASWADMRGKPEWDDPLFPGARETVERLAARTDVFLGIATGKSRKGVGALFEKTGWERHFHTIQTSDLHPSKPAPDMLLAALAETGADPAQAFMIGDSTYDMEMARSAGVCAIGVSWGYHRPELLRAAGAHTILTDFSGLDAALATVFDQAPAS